ncbi:MAG TPA: Flp family type IVb pilin [Stellaceae bacterium]|jgi:pilus assembly protein Flp/PilA|nr:Flp family type IVb pilin [Stellaceae bacterium]
MQKIRAALRLRLLAYCFSKNNAGATAIEYALVAMLIAMAIVAALPAIAPPINSTFNTVSSKL